MLQVPGQDKPKTILIVDDEDSNLFALSAVLKSRGFKSLLASGEGEAMTLLRQKSYNVCGVLMDLMLPGTNGFDIIRKIRADEHLQHLPIIMASALSGPEYVKQADEAGAQGYLTKPVDVDKLIGLLNEHIK